MKPLSPPRNLGEAYADAYGHLRGRLLVIAEYSKETETKERIEAALFDTAAILEREKERIRGNY